MFKMCALIISVLVALVGGHYIGQIVEPFILALVLSIGFGLICGIVGSSVGSRLDDRYGS